MEENDDNLSNKSRLIDIDDTVDTLEPKECDVAGEKSSDFECVGREIEEAEASIPVTESENLSENCVELEIDGKFSDGVEVEAGELERKDELSGEIEVSGVGVDASGIEVRDDKDDEIEGEVLYDTVRGDDKNDELEGEVVAEKKDELQGNYGCQVAKEGEVEGNGVDEGEILGDNDQVEDKDVCEDGFDDKQNVCVQVVAEKKDELEVEGGMNVGEEAGDKVVPESEIKDEAGVELQAGAVCEEVKAEELKGDCGTEVVGEALCEVGNEAENKSEIETEMKVSREPVKNVDDMVEEEKVEMGYVSSQSLNEVEERAANIEDNAEHSSGLIGLAEDTVMEEKNLVMESVNKKRDDELDSAPESDDEEDIMETGREYDEDKFEGEVPQPDGDSQLAEDEEDIMETEREFDEDKFEGEVPQPDGDSQLAEDEEDERLVGDEEIPAADVEMETETDAGELVKISGGKRKRGKNTKAAGKAQPLNMVGLPVEEEDVCFVCFDGGDLVLCDRKNCPKAYHASCVNRNEKFFQAKGRWNCGWHQCSHTNCQKNAYYMCYTCTFSLCKGCIKDAVILCVRGNKGFCEACIKIVMMIEDNAQGSQAQIDFDDKSSWEYLFKDYWIDLKESLSISPVEIAKAKNPWKGSALGASKNESPGEQLDTKDDVGVGTDNASDNPEASKPKKRKYSKRLKSRATKQDESTSEAITAGAERKSTPKSTEWASKELLEFVMHMRDGDRTVLSQFDVQALLLEYIKTNKLRDPRRKSQIICDARLENIFGKARVGHFEMLKLLESHFLMKEDTQIDDVQGSVVDTETNHVDADGNIECVIKSGKDRKRKTRKKDGRERQSNLDDYAAIDIHNISLIYLRRKLMEDLLEDIETFSDKVVDTFVRIRISGSNQKQDIYRLVQVKGTTKVDDFYKVGKRTTNLMIEILNLNKKEVISIDSISNQEFTEDECKRLRQSIKCGFIAPMTVGAIQDKAMEVQVARVNDWLESEVQRLTHLRDRASDLGKKKQLRECVESLQLLRTPEERRRRLEDIPEIHADPKMDPEFVSEDNDSEIDSSKQEIYTRPRGSGFSRRGREPISPGSGDAKESWTGSRRSSGKGWELNRNLSDKNLANTVEDAPLSIGVSADNSWNNGRGSETEKPIILEKPNSVTSSEAFGFNRNSAARSDSSSHVQSQKSPASLLAPVATAPLNISEIDKIWHYQDPHGKVQGPFSMAQLRKWSNTGYFPSDLRIWSSSGNKDDSLLLTDALAGKFQKLLPDNGIPNSNNLHNPHLPPLHSLHQGREVQDAEKLNSDQNHFTMDSNINSASRNWAAHSVEIPLLSADGTNSNHNGRNNLVNLPSPTPKQRSSGEAGRPIGGVSLPGSIEALQSPAAATPDSTRNLMLASEKTPSISHPAFGASPNPEQGNLLGSTISLPNPQSTVASLHGGQNVSHPFIAPETNANIVQSVTANNPALGTQNWAGAPTQSLEANSSIQASTQQPVYAQWSGVQSTPVQNPSINFPVQGVPQVPNSWRPPMQTNQTNMQPNVQWGTGIADNSASQNLQPDNPNSGWASMQVSPNIGWSGPNPNMNWMASVQGAQPGNLNAGWVIPGGSSGVGFQGAVPGNINSGWVPQPGNAVGVVQMLGPMNANQGWYSNMAASTQGAAPGNGNAGLAAPISNLGSNVQGQMPGNANTGWSAPSGNANQGWGPLAGNQGNNRSQHHRIGDKFSSQKDQGSQPGRNWNKPSSFGGGGGGPRHGGSRGICYMFQDTGHCKRGDSCSFRHSL
ncbi:zinc finger CCCH domain-containing protein 19 [Daucus carota subsp. sativus]|uniref:zinc finger CCCH domain-containing protein 19 n=1 Tax=Daucus carota subsp. sativus TaxID=79200 RepID=UPI0007EF97E0|nr:PREDICTED: zinc finger CCCH domain-containing protein 19 isoform X1 [Daucus carota subsp. sativus]